MKGLISQKSEKCEWLQYPVCVSWVWFFNKTEPQKLGYKLIFTLHIHYKVYFLVLIIAFAPYLECLPIESWIFSNAYFMTISDS